jgi:CDP-diacylglycerol--glycerol-3-phosphate 3-phosphatidyltransferase/cardiolipin synthase
MQVKSFIPSAVTGLRFISAPLFFYTFINGEYVFSLLIILFASVTDILDGYMARHMNATSNLGAYLDVAADFILVFFSFSALIVGGWYPYWVLGLISFIFILFIATSSSKKPIYDPVGKYLGSYLMGMVFFSVLFPLEFFRQILLAILILLTIISILSRILYLSGWKRMKVN